MPTLFQIDQELTLQLDLLETIEDQREREVLIEHIGNTLVSREEKIDGMAFWMEQKEALINVMKKSLKQITTLAQSRINKEVRSLERNQEIVSALIMSRGGEHLEGALTRFRVQYNPESVEIEDQLSVPDELCSTEFHFAPGDWQAFEAKVKDESVLDFLRDRISKQEPSKTAIKQALNAGKQVPGARLVKDKHHLVRE